MTNTDFHAIGLTLNLVGLYFLAISIVFKKPMAMVEEFFGVNKKHIEGIIQHVRNNIQVVIGFAFLFVGYCFQILYTLRPGGSEESTIFTRDNLLLIVVILLGSTIGLTILLRLVGFIWSKRSFKRLLTEFFKDYEWSFEENMAVTKEIGELLGIAKKREDTVEEYVAKVKQTLNIPEAPPRPKTQKITKTSLRNNP